MEQNWRTEQTQYMQNRTKLEYGTLNKDGTWKIYQRKPERTTNIKVGKLNRTNLEHGAKVENGKPKPEPREPKISTNKS